MESSIIAKLKSIGLTSYEAKCYLALVGKNEITATDVGKIADVPRSKVYDVLDRLSKKGLCYTVPGTVNKFKSAPPDMLEDKIKNKIKIIRKEIKERNDKLEKTITFGDEVISYLSDLFAKGRTNNEPLHYAEIINDKKLVHRKICELTKNIKKEILGFTRPPFTMPQDIMEEQDQSEVEVLKRNVTVKNIYQIPSEVEKIEEMIDIIKISEEDGEIAKVAYELPLKLLIYDEETVVYSLEDPILHKTSLTFSIVKHRSLAKFMKLAFESVWNSALEPSALKDILADKKNTSKSK